MAATGTPTPNIGLRIPQGTDPASVDDINYNSNLLDTKLGAVGETSVQDQIDSLNSNLTARTKYFSFTSTGSDRNAVLHAWMTTQGTHNALSSGDIACITGIFNSTMYYGLIAKVTPTVIMGHMFMPNYPSGFYFRDSSTDAAATSTDFSL